MADDFAKAVEDGLKFAKRVYLGKDRAVAAPPRPSPAMERSSSQAYLPTAPMLYAVISDPAIVDNPDLPSYQPHVHGRCDPPALIPLQMNAIELEVDCFLDTALIRVTGSWRVHCVMGSRSCDCLIAIPMGEQGLVLGVDVEIPRKSYTTQLITSDHGNEMEKNARPRTGNGGFLKPNIFTLTIPQVDGGTNLSVKLSWSQKLLYIDGEFFVDVPFKFPEYVTPAVKKLSKKEKIHLSLNAGADTKILCKGSSHPLKEKTRNAGRLGFSYEAEVLKWSNTNFSFSYVVSSSNIFGGLFLQSPPVYDVDQRGIFSIYLIPGSQQSTKVFKREVVFVVDLSGSMSGKPLEDVKSAISTALSKLSAGDSFNIITFSDDTSLFSTSMESATADAVERGIQWMSETFVASGGTSMLPPLEKAVEMLSNTRSSAPMIFFITDGSVEDERHIINVIKKRLACSGSLCPRIYTFGIGIFCNHYFLKMLANLSKGQDESAYVTDHIEERMEKQFTKALSTILMNVTIEPLQNLEEVEVYPSNIPDLSSASPLIISGRCRGKFPENVKAKGLLGDFSSFALDLTVQNVKDMPLDKILAKNVIDMLTEEAWLLEDRQLQEKIAKISIQTGVPSEYTQMILLENIEGPKPKEAGGKKKASRNSEKQKLASRKIPLQSIGTGFGDVAATSDNVSPGFEAQKPPDAAEVLAKAASNCCTSVCNKCCCMCCIQCCSKLNDQCVIVLTQLFSAVAFIACFECCSQVCCPGDDG
ncbi:PREDICTED: inter-alpha-trypsin inhibitor heavy chain H3-like [Tarenaya hassleriana]|uniref:inter-alpha-trypsin inhibitor heavy chain H3-like n=1 Tax=Tarenaya hassleriana TaxID=28532 RepID=UPI00053C4EC6|nr:PREDICTED: inter-alpha-trypsin inhibitor heavy chain H3-like [Tarenaya hassleriana]